MLAELAVYARSYRRTPAAFRPHLMAAARHWARGVRQARAWAPHLANARGLLDTTIDDLPVRRAVAVLGSGPLFELPLESLARTFERVILVDRIHLSAIEARIARYSNVSLDWRDLCPAGNPGVLDFLQQIDGLDWVISANVVSEMAAAAPALAREVVDRHLDALVALPCPVTLITDLDYRVFNRHGIMRDSGDMLHGRQMPRSGLRWKWEAAPFGEEARHTRRVHYVAAWHDRRRA